jgi:hypothetical protein
MWLKILRVGELHISHGNPCCESVIPYPGNLQLGHNEFTFSASFTAVC